MTLPVVVLHFSVGKVSRIHYTGCWIWYLTLFVVDLIRKPISCTLYMKLRDLIIHMFSN